ncbi:MAG: hypothetical protein K2X47_15075, partial [Bdellovibrionales bacterium]|nr:hypothetical protein [Bdellovibrionales bacterium]
VVNIVVDQGRWLEMGNAADFLEASHDLMATLEGVFKNKNASSSFKDFFEWGWQAFDPSSFEQRGSARIVLSKSVHLLPNFSCAGDITIGKGFEPKPSQKISNSILVGKIQDIPNNALSDELYVGEYPFPIDPTA